MDSTAHDTRNRTRTWTALPAAALVGALSLTGCGVLGPDWSGEGVPAGSPAADAGVVVEGAGFGQRDDRVWATSVVRNEAGAPGQTVTVTFTLLDGAGDVLAVAEQSEMFTAAGQRLAVGTQAAVPAGSVVAAVEETALVVDGAAPEFADVTVATGDAALRTGGDGELAVSATVTNTSDVPIVGARVGVVCYDDAGTIVGGSSNFPGPLAAGQEVTIDSDDVIVSGEPASCDVLATPGTPG